MSQTRSTSVDTGRLRELAERALSNEDDSLGEAAAWREFIDAITPQTVLALLDEIETLRGGETCQACGNPYPHVYTVPDSVWQLITPKPDQRGAGLLCPVCALTRLANRTQAVVEAAREVRERLPSEHLGCTEVSLPAGPLNKLRAALAALEPPKLTRPTKGTTMSEDPYRNEVLGDNMTDRDDSKISQRPYRYPLNTVVQEALREWCNISVLSLVRHDQELQRAEFMGVGEGLVEHDRPTVSLSEKQWVDLGEPTVLTIAIQEEGSFIGVSRLRENIKQAAQGMSATDLQTAIAELLSDPTVGPIHRSALLAALEPVQEGPKPKPKSKPITDEQGYFHGFDGPNAHEHRTAGPHRAWCFNCSEWCDPRAPCVRCGEPAP